MCISKILKNTLLTNRHLFVIISVHNNFALNL